MTPRFLAQTSLRWESCRRSEVWGKDPKFSMRCLSGEIREEPHNITQLINVRNRRESCQGYLTPKSKFFHNTEIKVRIMMVTMMNMIQYQLRVTELLLCVRYSQPIY